MIVNSHPPLPDMIFVVGRRILEERGFELLMGKGEEKETDIAIRYIKRANARRRRILNMKG